MVTVFVVEAPHGLEVKGVIVDGVVVEDEGDATVPQVMGSLLQSAWKMDVLMLSAVVAMVSGSSVGVSGCVGGGGWWRILCWVILCREWTKHVGAVGC
jgi:hypothetical protein